MNKKCFIAIVITFHTGILHQESNLVLEMKWTHQIFVYVEDVNLIGDNINTIEIQKSCIACKNIDLEVNMEKNIINGHV